MIGFTETQIDFLEKVYKINPDELFYAVKIQDGYVKEGDTVYWWGQDALDEGKNGEMFIYNHKSRQQHKKNMEQFPNLYSLKEPRIIHAFTIEPEGEDL